MSEWTSVRDRLPEPSKPVLVCFDLLESLIRRDRKIEKRGLIEIDYVIEYPTGNFRWNNSKYHLATHWMPLPEKPKEE